MERQNRANMLRAQNLRKITNNQTKLSKPQKQQNEQKFVKNRSVASKVNLSKNKVLPTILASTPLDNNFIKATILGKTINEPPHEISNNMAFSQV